MASGKLGLENYESSGIIRLFNGLKYYEINNTTCLCDAINGLFDTVQRQITILTPTAAKPYQRF